MDRSHSQPNVGGVGVRRSGDGDIQKNLSPPGEKTTSIPYVRLLTSIYSMLQRKEVISGSSIKLVLTSRSGRPYALSLLLLRT